MELIFQLWIILSRSLQFVSNWQNLASIDDQVTGKFLKI